MFAIRKRNKVNGIAVSLDTAIFCFRKVRKIDLISIDSFQQNIVVALTKKHKIRHFFLYFLAEIHIIVIMG